MVARFVVGGGIGTTANLNTLTAVSTAVGSVEAHVALAADGHTEGAVTEHLYADLFPAWAANVFCLYLTVYLRYLVHVQFAGEYYDIGKLRIEAQGLDVRDVQLGGEVYLLSHLITIGHHGHIRCDDGGDARLFGSIDDLVHQGDVLAIDDGVDGEVALDAVCLALLGDVAQVVDGERGGGVRPHVQFLDAEVDAVCSCLYRCRQGLARAHGSHDFKVFYSHSGCKDNKKVKK